MIFPIGDTNVQGGSKPLVTYIFLGINVLIFLFQITLSQEDLAGFIYTYGSIPAEVMAGQDTFTLLTNMFLHGGWMHIIGNMLFLWVFADNIEAVIGSAWFFVFYIIGGASASIIHTVLSPESTIPAVGASGAIAAVMGAYLVMFPKSQIKVFVIYIFRSFNMAAIWFLGIWIVQNLVSGFMSLGVQNANQGGTAWWAHIGGFVFGVLAGFAMKKMFSYRSGQPQEDFPMV